MISLTFGVLILLSVEMVIIIFSNTNNKFMALGSHASISSCNNCVYISESLTEVFRLRKFRKSAPSHRGAARKTCREDGGPCRRTQSPPFPRMVAFWKTRFSENERQMVRFSAVWNLCCFVGRFMQLRLSYFCFMDRMS